MDKDNPFDLNTRLLIHALIRADTKRWIVVPNETAQYIKASKFASPLVDTKS